MNQTTAKNIQSAYGGESMAHMRYLSWADKADKDGFANVARLFRAVSRAEQAHAMGHFRVLKEVAGGADVTAGAAFGICSTAENLALAIEGELHEIDVMYPEFLAQAKESDEKAAIRAMDFALAAEKIHAAMFADAKTAVEAGNDYDVDKIQICPVCGHTMAGDAPEKCPICGAKGELYIAFE